MPDRAPPSADAHAEDLKRRLRHLADVSFPAAASRGSYPVRLNHCFLRIVYDNLLGAPWRTVFPKGAALHQLSTAQLERAVALGEEIVADPHLCAELNRRSLVWRGKA